MTRLTLYERLRFRFQQDVSDRVTPWVSEPYRRWRNAGRDFRPIFVAGAMGSGTSLLAVSLGQRFDVAGVVYESARQISRRSFLHVARMDEFDSIAEYASQIRAEETWSVDDGRRDLVALYRSYGSGPGDTIIDKGPNTNLFRARFLARCFPDAVWLLIFRDPVANVEGFRRKWSTFGAESVEANARFWVEGYDDCLHALDALGRRVMVVDYAALAAESDAVLDGLGRELGLANATRRARLRSRVNVEGWGIRNVSRNEIGVVRDADARAVARVPAEDARLIRTLCEPLAATLRRRATSVRAGSRTPRDRVR